MTFQMNIEEIINNDNFTISEKLAKLSDLEEKYRQKIEKYCQKIERVKKEITTDYRYCPKCKDYYKRTAWEDGVRSVTHQRCTNPTMGYLEKYEYEDVVEQEFYTECPKGHKIVDNYGY